MVPSTSCRTGSHFRCRPRPDVSIYLVADRDPLLGRLATIGCRIVVPGREPEMVVRTIRTREEELESLMIVLGTVVQCLRRTDEWNRQRAESGLEGRILHIFVYEPAEARDLAQALNDHLDQKGRATGAARPHSNVSPRGE